MNYILDYNNLFCNNFFQDIIKQFEEEHYDNMFVIPKNNNKWEKIERELYKEILLKFYDYYKSISNNNTNNFLSLLINNKFYIKQFSIQKISIDYKSNKYYFLPDRYNILTFILYLNNVCDENEITFTSSIIIDDKSNILKIKTSMGKLIIFPENTNYIYNFILPKNASQYIITGQIAYYI